MLHQLRFPVFNVYKTILTFCYSVRYGCSVRYDFRIGYLSLGTPLLVETFLDSIYWNQFNLIWKYKSGIYTTKTNDFQLYSVMSVTANTFDLTHMY